jgi:rhamnosyltransferase
MATNGVCGVMVTFFPPEGVLQNVAAIRSQVEALVVVDNGSPVIELDNLRAVREELRFTLIENGDNRGIAAALNIGVRWARARGYRWIALFDQDSLTSDGMIDRMIRKYDLSLHCKNIAIVMPKHIERHSSVWIRPFVASDGNPLFAITSGSLIPSQTFALCGEFEEDLFIDCVDIEYCLRARSLGWTICLCEEAILYHAVGAPQRRRLWGIRTLRTLNHRAERRYYIARNNIVMFRRYWRQFSRWCFDDLVSVTKEFAKVILIEKNRRRQLSMIALGTLDGMRGRMGPVVKM